MIIKSTSLSTSPRASPLMRSEMQIQFLLDLLGGALSRPDDKAFLILALAPAQSNAYDVNCDYTIHYNVYGYIGVFVGRCRLDNF